MADITKIVLPNGNEYTIKDATARTEIQKVKNTTNGVMTYVGTTTTPIKDGDTTSPVSIGAGESTKDHNPLVGDVVVYNNVSYAWTGDQWDQWGSAGALKGLAYKDSAAGKVVAEGSISQPSWTPTPTEVNLSGTASGDVVIGTGEGDANYVPKGNIKGKPTVTLNYTSVTPIAEVGSLPKWEATVADETLNITWAPGTTPKKGDAVTVATDVKDTALGNLSFEGEGTHLTGTFSNGKASVTGDVSAKGTVGTPTFKGTEVSVTVQ